MIKIDPLIETPVIDILMEAIPACIGVGDGMEVYPLFEYIEQAIFIKMTGFEEQKLKKLIWMLADHDENIKVEYLRNVSSIGQFSSYRQKNIVYKHLCAAIEKNGGNVTIIPVHKKRIIDESKKSIINIFLNSNIRFANEKEFNRFKKEFKLDTSKIAPNKGNFLESKTQKWYDDIIIKNRNRIAHNVFATYNNLPTFQEIAVRDYKHNYFAWLTMILIIDSIFNYQFKKYYNLISKNPYYF